MTVNRDFERQNAKSKIAAGSTEIYQDIINTSNGDAFHISYVKAVDEFRVSGKKNGSWGAEQKLITNSDLENRLIFEFRPLTTDDDVKAYFNALPDHTIRCDYNYNGKEYTYIFSRNTSQNGNILRIASSGGSLETRCIVNGTWSDWMAK